MDSICKRERMVTIAELVTPVSVMSDFTDQALCNIISYVKLSE